MKIAITGRIQTGSYTNKEGQKVYTTDVVIEEQEFAEGKNASGADREARDEAALQQSGYKQSSMTMWIKMPLMQRNRNANSLRQP